MFFVDPQRTVTRRSSSLIVNRNLENQDADADTICTIKAHSAARFANESTGSLRIKNTVQDEIVTMMFESMLDSIVESWESISAPKRDDSIPTLMLDIPKTASETTFMSRKKKSVSSKYSKTKSTRSRSKLEVISMNQGSNVWWTGADERAIIKFRNGNVYEGNISMKCMNGEGRFQWADGTVYLGQFKNNEMHGKGRIEWKDDTWYEGEFRGNMRHGKGLFVDSRTQRSYAGDWYYGTKHGEGVIYYSRGFKNSYDGHWVFNERFGYGSREYSESSGYKGEWDRNIREGQGLMMWPNHDFYRGDWKNGVMSGHGMYIWDAYFNNTMACPSINAHRGFWHKGQRNGYGVLNLGLGLGSHYNGQFRNDKKDGQGKFVTNNGLILQDKHLFIQDNLGPLSALSNDNSQEFRRAVENPYKFDICDNFVGLFYHIDQAIKNIDRQALITANIIDEYMERNGLIVVSNTQLTQRDDASRSPMILDPAKLQDFISLEENSLRNALSSYEVDLLNIYNKYATICNTEEIVFKPILKRLFLWQLYYDCRINDKGLTLVEIDNIFHQNPEWISKSPHHPFEKVYFWQFIHSLISIASKLYAKKELPSAKPDTILASAFRTFMEKDILPGSTQHRGRLVNGYGKFVPLKATYKLYREIGEPHTVRDFLCAARRASHCSDRLQPNLVEPPESCLPLGRNVYIFGDELTFVVDDDLPDVIEDTENVGDLKLFNFGNLSTKTIIKIFSKIFPNLCTNSLIIDLDIEMTFFEFFEAFIECAEESIRVKEEELKWRAKFYEDHDLQSQQAPSTPSGQHPPTQHSPAQQTPTQRPPTQQPPTTKPPTQKPPTPKPSAQKPPTPKPSAQKPSAQRPPSKGK